MGGAMLTTPNPVQAATSSGSSTECKEISDALDSPGNDFDRGFRFWAIIIGLGITNLLGALENTVVSTSAPVILSDLQLGGNYIWITNAFFVCIFTLGSGICGGARSGAMLIAGRAVQGVGSGGIIMVIDIIVSDLVPLRQRGNYMAVVLAIYGVGTSLGPFIGGAIVSSTTWRWVFWINLPIGGASLVILYLFLHVNYNKEMTFSQKIKRIDFIGSGILMAALSRWGKFRPLHFAGFALWTIGLGLFSLQDEATSVAEWAIFQCVMALGAGMVLNTLLPSFQAPAAEKDQAAATATWCFIRTLGYVWGVAIPAAIFNNRVDALLYRISDPTIREQLASGGAYQSASAAFVKQFPLEDQDDIRAVYREALERVWEIAVVFAGFACLLRAIVEDSSGKARLVKDAPLPALLPGTVIVRTTAVALQPADNKIRKRFPSKGAVIGNDFAGIVVRAHLDTASDVWLEPGDLVCGVVHGSNLDPDQAERNNGAFAEYVRAPVEFVLRLSSKTDMSPAQAATLGTALATISMSLWADPSALDLTATPDTPATQASPVLVYGGSSSVGTMATQLLKLSGLAPVVTCSPRNFDLARKYGATEIFDYTHPGGIETGEVIRRDTDGRLRHALDCAVDADSVSCCYAAFGRVGGRYVSLESCPEELRTRRSVRAHFVMGLEVFGKEVKLGGEYGRPASKEKHDTAARCFRMFQRLLDEGRLEAHPVQIVQGGFDGILQGLELLAQGAVSGKKLVALL
ncbi:hypothetical protein VMCG_04869 [Cytospora schulzeri]|uniref:Enoyl reductase (ER) domain-containing protein n=1 Tax=Cytospora schulzeri TaxID=448051 RepID=A0A423WMP0_9PEZI|nr:hypothetical protein VMCG_04869 [Valsa malicola]